MTPTLVSARCTLTELNGHDVDAVFELCQDPEIQAWVPIPSPYTRTDAEFYVNEYVAHGQVSGTYSVWGIRADVVGPVLGVIEVRADAAMGSSSIGCWLGAPSRSRGIMTEALGAVIDFCFSEAGGSLRQIRWEGLAGNEASARLAGRLGFELTTTPGHSVEFREHKRDGWLAILSAADYTGRIAGGN